MNTQIFDVDKEMAYVSQAFKTKETDQRRELNARKKWESLLRGMRIKKARQADLSGGAEITP